MAPQLWPAASTKSVQRGGCAHASQATDGSVHASFPRGFWFVPMRLRPRLLHLVEAATTPVSKLWVPARVGAPADKRPESPEKRGFPNEKAGGAIDEQPELSLLRRAQPW